MINRINLILRAKNITARQFAEEIGIQPSGMSHILSGRNNPSLDFVAKVLRRYPEIDANWLLLGRGEMYSSGAPSPLPTTPPYPAPAVTDYATSMHDEDQVHTDEPAQESLYDAENESYIEPLANSLAEAPTPPSRRLSKLLFIYSDGTFEECVPQR